MRWGPRFLSNRQRLLRNARGFTLSVMRSVVAGAVCLVWCVGYLMAYFVDRQLVDIAQGATPVMMVVAGFLFGQGAAEIFKGRDGDRA